MDKKNIYLLLGPEEGEKKTYIKNYVAKISKEFGEKPEILRFYSFESKMINIVATLQNKSLFSHHTIILLYETEIIKSGDELKILLDYLEKPSEEATLFLLSDTIQMISKKIVSKVPAANKKIFWELSETKKRSWIHDFFRQRDMSIEQPALEFLLEMVENNTHDLKTSCNKLALFFGPQGIIKEEDLEKYIYHSREENVFTLFERIAIRDFSSSIEILHKILVSGESDAIHLISGLRWQMRKLLSLKRFINQNYHINEVYQKLKIWGKKNQHIFSQAHNEYTQEEVVFILVLLSDFNVEFRSSKADIHTVLLQLLVYCIVKKGGKRKKGKDILFF